MRSFVPSAWSPAPSVRSAPGLGTPTALRLLGPLDTHEPVGVYGAASLPGVTVNAGVNLTLGMQQFLQQLRTRLPAAVPITVTSGTRSVEEQASAMLKKLAAGGAQELYNVYKDDATISVLLKTPQSVSAWAEVIRARAPSLSRHMSGRALDLHTRTLTASQVQQLKAACEALGATTLLEAAPPHLHVDLPLALAVASIGETAAKRAVSLWAISMGIGAVAVGGLVLLDMLRRRGGTARGSARVGTAPATEPVRAIPPV